LTPTGSTVDVDAANGGRAGVGPDEAGEHLHRGGFAGAVGAEETEDFAAVDGEADAVDGALGAVGFNEAFDFDHGKEVGVRRKRSALGNGTRKKFRPGFKRIFSAAPRLAPGGWARVGQENREQAEQRQERADVKYVVDAGVVGEATERRGADAAHAEGEAEKDPGDEPDAARDEFLSVDQYRGKGGGEDEANDDAEGGRSVEVGVGQEEGERGDPKNGDPDDRLAPDAIAHGAADDRAGGDGAENRKRRNCDVGIETWNFSMR